MSKPIDRYAARFFTTSILTVPIWVSALVALHFHADAATTITWDSNTGTSGAQDGSGTWSVGGTAWWNGSADVATTNDINTNIAQFGNSGTLATVATVNVATQSINGLVFATTTTNGYTLTNTAASTLTIGSGGITMNNGAQATTVGDANLSLALGANQTWTNNSSSNALTVGGNVTNSTFALTIAGVGAVNISGNIGSGTGGLTKNGTGTTTLSGTNGYTGTTTVNAGTLQVGNGTAGSLASTSALALGGGTFTLLGTSAGGSQTVASLAVNAGASAIVVNTNGGTTTLNVKAITRNVGGTIDFSGTGGTITSTTNTTGGILGGYATFGGNTWAVANGASPITGLSSYVSDTWAAGNNTTVTQPTNTAYNNVTTNSLRFNNTAADTVTLSGTNVITTGGILVTSTVGSGNLSTITGGTLEGAASKDLVAIVNNTGGLRIDSIIANNSGATGLTVSGPGTLTLTAANTFTGATTVNGTLNLSNSLALQNSTLNTGGTGLVFDSSVGSHAFTFGGLAGSGPLNLVDNAANPVTLTVGGNNASTTYSGVLSGAGVLNKTGTGTLGLSNTSSSTPSTFSGTINVLSGTLSVGTGLGFTGAGSSNTMIVFSSGATLSVGGVGFGSFNTTFNGSSGLTVSLQGGNLGGTCTLASGNTSIASNNSSFPTGSFGFKITGPGALTIGGTALGSYVDTVGISNAANNWTGGLTITRTTGSPGNVGILKTTGTNVLAANAVTFKNGTYSVLDVGGKNQTVDLLTSNAAGDGMIINSSTTTAATLTIGGGTGASATFSGAISNISTITESGGVITASGTGAALSLTKIGNGAQTLSGANTYAGATTISGGTLQFAQRTSLYNATTAGWTAANIIVNSGGTAAFNVGGTGEFTPGDVTTLLTNLSTVNNNGLKSGSSIGFDTTNASGGTFTVSDAIANSTGTGGGAVGVTKLGSNTLVLSGASTYTGATAVNGGKVVVSGSLSGTVNVNVGASGTLASGVTGSITTASAGNISVSGTLAPGDIGTVGTLTLAPGTGGKLSFASGSTLAIDINGASSDQVAFSTAGDWLLGSGNVTLSLSGIGTGINYADTYTLFSNVTTSGFNVASITGYDTVDYLANFTQAGNLYQLSFTAIPEPGTATSLVGGLGILVAWRRRQRRGQR